MIPASHHSGKMFYLNDFIDNDAIIRFYLSERLHDFSGTNSE
jgi:hypothetical protein